MEEAEVGLLRAVSRADGDGSLLSRAKDEWVQKTAVRREVPAGILRNCLKKADCENFRQIHSILSPKSRMSVFFGDRPSPQKSNEHDRTK